MAMFFESSGWEHRALAAEADAERLAMTLASVAANPSVLSSDVLRKIGEAFQGHGDALKVKQGYGKR